MAAHVAAIIPFDLEMGILDWLNPRGDESGERPGLSRRDFFARVVGRSGEAAEQQRPAARDPNVLHVFHVDGFPFYDGPVLVPVLRPGTNFELVPETGHATDPNALRIQWKRDHLGYVPAELAEELRALLAGGVKLVCRAVRVSPNVELSRVLEVEVRRVEEEPGPDRNDDESGGVE
ncbi:MAG: hypothetical protein GEU90_04450 [Gemmatimonas sp.]|nr:hypothetical protein [Gemmatimonas sp.]